MKEIKEYIAKHAAMLPLAKSISTAEAERKAGDFLMAMATIADWKHVITEDKIRLLSVQTAVYSDQLGKGTAKTMTENKVTAEASDEYREAREGLEKIENDISYLKTYADIFMAAHVFYRNMAKGGNDL